MKKIISIFAILLLTISCAACGKKSDKEVAIYVPDGAPALAIAKAMANEYAPEGYKVSYHVVASDTIASHVSNGDATMAILPTNAAANLYNKGVKINIVSSNTWGLLYMVGNADNKTPIADLNTLKGEVVGIIGQGQVPDLIFKYILNKANIPFEVSDTSVAGKVALKYVSDGATMIPLLKTKTLKYGILGEPAVSNSIAKAGTGVVLDIQTAWSSASGKEGSYPQASLVVNSKFLKNNCKFVKDFLDYIDDSDYLKDNASELGQVLTDNGSTAGLSFTTEIIQRCNIRVVKNKDMKDAVAAFLESLGSVAMPAIGGKLPDENFYFTIS